MPSSRRTDAPSWNSDRSPFGRRAALDMAPFDGPEELTWYEGLPWTLKQAYGQWREKRSALTEVIEEV